MKTALMIFALPAVFALCACSSNKWAEQACSPPRQHWQQPVNTNVIDYPKVDLAIDRQGKIYVEGDQVSLSALERRLSAIPRDEAPTTRVFLETEMGANCHVIESVRATFDKSLNCRQPFRCNEGIQTLWKQLPVAPGTPAS
jgi:biopolymer transport protein ExbD